jgi:hypothetical protein
MAERVPLNFYKRITSSLLRNSVPIYTVPLDRASVILNTFTNNNTDNNRFITISLSGNVTNNVTLLNRFPLHVKDVINLSPYKLILSEGDTIVVTSDIEDIVTLNDPAVFWEFDLPVSLVNLTDFTIGFTQSTNITADFGTNNLNVTTSQVTLTSNINTNYTYNLSNGTNTNMTLSILEVDNRP